MTFMILPVVHVVFTRREFRTQAIVLVPLVFAVTTRRVYDAFPPGQKGYQGA